ncbi:MAG: hypothetical protein VB862_04740, partial [Pirellulaceae bacterium]
ECAGLIMSSFLAGDCFVLDIFYRKFVQLDQLLTIGPVKQGNFSSRSTTRRLGQKSDHERAFGDCQPTDRAAQENSSQSV